jgi:hypothetical protein
VRIGVVVGYGLLGLVDALVPAALVTGAVLGFGVYTDGSLLAAALGAGAAVLGLGAAVGAVSASRGGKPFPLARRALALWKRYWWV